MVCIHTGRMVSILTTLECMPVSVVSILTVRIVRVHATICVLSAYHYLCGKYT